MEEVSSKESKNLALKIDSAKDLLRLFDVAERKRYRTESVLESFQKGSNVVAPPALVEEICNRFRFSRGIKSPDFLMLKGPHGLTSYALKDLLVKHNQMRLSGWLDLHLGSPNVNGMSAVVIEKTGVALEYSFEKSGVFSNALVVYDENTYFEQFVSVLKRNIVEDLIHEQKDVTHTRAISGMMNALITLSLRFRMMHPSEYVKKQMGKTVVFENLKGVSGKTPVVYSDCSIRRIVCDIFHIATTTLKLKEYLEAEIEVNGAFCETHQLPQKFDLFFSPFSSLEKWSDAVREYKEKGVRTMYRSYYLDWELSGSLYYYWNELGVEKCRAYAILEIILRYYGMKEAALENVIKTYDFRVDNVIQRIGKDKFDKYCFERNEFLKNIATSIETAWKRLSETEKEFENLIPRSIISPNSFLYKHVKEHQGTPDKPITFVPVLLLFKDVQGVLPRGQEVLLPSGVESNGLLFCVEKEQSMFEIISVLKEWWEKNSWPLSGGFCIYVYIGSREDLEDQFDAPRNK